MVDAIKHKILTNYRRTAKRNNDAKEDKGRNFPNFFLPAKVDDFNHNDSEMRRQPTFSCVANMPTCDRKMKEGKLGL